MQVFLSNKVECLYQEFRASLFACPTTPFTSRYVIVPSPAMRSWVLKALAEDPAIGIAAGVRVTYMEEALSQVIDALSADPKHFPAKISYLERSLRLEVAIQEVFERFVSMGEGEKAIWQPLIDYTERDSRRVVSLVAKLVPLFDRYEIYGQSLLRTWQQTPAKSGEWQKALWKLCVDRVYPEEMEWIQQDCAIHLFGQTFLPKQYYTIFRSLSKKNSVHGYFISPCRFFWSEILSDKQCSGLLQRLQKEGVQEAQQLAMEEYIYDRNPILANFGRVGREMALLIENEHDFPEERYQLSSQFRLQPFYDEMVSDDIHFSENASKPSLLECLQADLLLMRRPAPEEVFKFSDEEQSIQIHQATSPMREVESLYDTLITLIDRHQRNGDPILPEDVIVMAPDIMQYEPYIHAVFSRKDSLLDYQILDLNLLSRYPLIKGFVSLLALAQSKWDVSSVLELFENSAFQEKQKFTKENLQLLKRWIQSVGIRWGIDGYHRRDLLKEKYHKTASIDREQGGTWGLGFRRLLLGLITNSEVDEIESSQAELLGRYIELIDSLEKDLTPLREGTYRTLSEWALYLKRLIKFYFVDLENASEQDDASQNMRDFLDRLDLDHKFPGKSFPFSTIRAHLDTFLNQKIFGYKESHLHAVRFCSLLPMRALPAKVIVLLGMDEESYPRKEPKDSLNMLKTHPEVDYCPSLSDFDRYIFLEVLLSARCYLLFFYSIYSFNDGKEQNASILVSELMNYLDSGFLISGKKPSEACVKVHPFSPWDRRLFMQHTDVQSYSKTYHRAAKVKGKEEEHFVIPTFFAPRFSAVKIPESIDLKLLGMISKNPIEAFFKKRLKIYLKEFEGLEKKNEEDFVLGPLEHFLLKQESLKQPLDRLLERASKKGELPSGPFREFSLLKLQQEACSIQKNLANLQVDPAEIFDVYLSAEVESPQQDSLGHWMVPAIKCVFEGKMICVEGKLPQVSRKGLISLQNDDKTQQIRSWPYHLVFALLSRQYSFVEEGTLLFAKSGKSKKIVLESPLDLLEKYICYHFTALEQPSPLLPEWVGEFVKNDAAALEKKIDAFAKCGENYFFNPYVKWAFGQVEAGKIQSLVDSWHPTAVELFAHAFPAGN